jgi:hypothetical protein
MKVQIQAFAKMTEPPAVALLDVTGTAHHLAVHGGNGTHAPAQARGLFGPDGNLYLTFTDESCPN